LLQRKVAAGATFVQSQMVFDLPRLEAFLARGEDMLAGVRVYASVALLRSERMAERACALPGVTIPEPACAQIRRGGGIELARASWRPGSPVSRAWTHCTSSRSGRKRPRARSPPSFG